ncbi:MAG: hypothetical protein NTY25_05730, partial [Planctomycetia bacterium]|nr:hypothetical protein [Planctomycetia bacterium]
MRNSSDGSHTVESQPLFVPLRKTWETRTPEQTWLESLHHDDIVNIQTSQCESTFTVRKCPS